MSTPTQQQQQQQQQPGGKIVVLNGFPGTGKLSILKKVLAKLPRDTTHLIDNLKIADLALELYPFCSVDHYAMRRTIRASFCNDVRRLARDGRVVLLTECLAETEKNDVAIFKAYMSTARETGVQLIWINASCDLAVMEERVENHERYWSRKAKLLDQFLVKTKAKKHRLVNPLDHCNDPAMLSFDTMNTNGNKEQSVNLVMEKAGLKSV